MQLIHAIPLILKQKKNGSKKNIETNHVVQDHQSMSYKTIKVCRTRPSPNKKH